LIVRREQSVTLKVSLAAFDAANSEAALNYWNMLRVVYSPADEACA
jgi:hypothetical protein